MNVFRKILIAGCVAAASVAPVAHAEKFFGDSSVTILHSDQYEGVEFDAGGTGGREFEATVFTFENITAHNWGNTFFFIDRSQGQGSDEGNDSVYGEIHPVVSGSWLTGSDLSFGPVKDVFLATQYEFGGGNQVNNYLGGFGVAWDVPGFLYLKSSFYYVDNDKTNDDLQMTVAFGVPLEMGPALFLIDGHMDWSSSAGDHRSEFLFMPQIKLDVSNFWDEPGVLYAGVEYHYWNNKFGLGENFVNNGSSVSAMVTYHF